MRRLLKWTVILAAVNTVVWAAGRAITRSMTSQDLSADDLELYVFWNGAEYVPHSGSLRTVKARVLMGGATIDLREAEPSSRGITLDVATVMGGTAVLVRKDWDVEVIEQTTAGGVEVRLDAGAEVPSDRPRVTIRLATSLGGALVGYELPAGRGAQAQNSSLA